MLVFVDQSKRFSTFSNKLKIYSLKITEKGSIIHEFIPVHNTITNSAGLYDTKNEIFYPNNGTENFIEGPEKNSN